MLRMPLVVLFSLFISVGCGGSDSGTDVVTGENLPCPTRNAPLPPGGTPEGFITLEGYHYNCGTDDIIRYHSDGTFTGKFSESDPDYHNLVTYWQRCRSGPRPPETSGRWVVTEHGEMCLRIDNLPQIVGCEYIGSNFTRDDSTGQITSYTITDTTVYDEYGDYLDTINEVSTCNLVED